MIELYTGTPGSGKSLHASKTILEWLPKHQVITNFELNLDSKKNLRYKKNYNYLNNMELTPKKLIDFARRYWFEKGTKIKEDKILLVIDECQMIFNCRSWGQKDRMEWLGFFTQHRKYGFKIVLITQFDAMIDKQIRSVIEYEFIHRKIGNFGLVGKIVSCLSLGKLFCVVKIWYPMTEKIGVTFFKCHKKHYEIYDTFNTFEQA